MSKTVKGWFKTIEDKEVKEKALKNLGNPNTYPFPDDVCECLSEAILNGFSWRFTPEGYEYWDTICTQYESPTSHE